eukprot:CAMPEP_0172439708 /NCGR_PEP_ID=MMETSP1065-20121228/606_1 /TAXON_ID=265537 /ORGANISM="Amphiprora paludosa, Strain CCMP125" /LENGTH=174 /DNA_ID=CAMNT_0013188427 /DNA_START=154 /DNA_END=678 /DNA_ORIENTATION=-
MMMQRLLLSRNTRYLLQRGIATNLASSTATTTTIPTLNAEQLAAAAASATPTNQATMKHLQQVSQAIEKVILEKEQAPTTAATDAVDEKTEQAWQAFEHSYQNAKSCVADVVANEAPEHWQEEVETAEEALTQAQASFLEVLEMTEERESRREQAAIHLRQLRQQLDGLADVAN